ncbi:zinc fingers and homeoboxes protein 3 [Tachyglossus aculeatus]|uniref:zinc fingers and homeoboxes protein 3 n=1 Tax=Tachyglossus aculeatus TaxID=9261 RepID=UPI0018F45860|nr:zinc fingers and homeoboxes protein 3 [Tachyglossus aculeatus]XP_038605933.1 zinc fingers and homeoboxes protein 3 [Tachyglossus aculeatus]XP_038605934.1 zinc fingers and homeoboxes protein 3 [Tachyglossus aculeatus]XP_038605935.1 zinc fingers and homeoboxes protein 3 [Tachyglossus aculeatus]XP_038605936.1 zinc fingers and homeoboxes protein 3 [Tachyglossus aculeatus]
MASKRKSTTPCMIPVKTVVLQQREADPANEGPHQDPAPEVLRVSDAANNPNRSGAPADGRCEGDTYLCKYCDFGSQDMSPFMGHMDSEHTDFSQDPSFVCTECSFLAKTCEGLTLHNAKCHAGETRFIWNVARQDSHVTVEQSVSDSTSSQEFSGESSQEGSEGQPEIIITKTPIMKLMKGKAEAKKIHTLKENLPGQTAGESGANPAAGGPEGKESERLLANGPGPVSQAPSVPVKTPHVVNGSLIGTVPVLPAGVAQFLSIQQPPQALPQQQPLPTSKSLPKVMIPLSSIPTYNAAMDSNSFLKNSFHKFPYPTKAELCYLTVVTKYPEEQLKIWFTAQRLKQGISWSPEEIEDARKKMFNTVIQSVPQPTITVLNTPIVANAGNVQHLIQAAIPGHVVRQPEGPGGLMVSQPVVANGLQGTGSSLPGVVTSAPKPPPAAPRNTGCSSSAATVKVVTAAQSLLTACPSITSQAFLDASLFKNKKSHEQLSALKGSFCRNQFPGQSEVEHLTKVTGLTTREVRKWFSDRRYHCRNLKGARSVFGGESGALIIDSAPEIAFSLSPKAPDFTCLAAPATIPTSPTAHHGSTRRQSWHQTPDFTPTRYKERAPEQLRALESSFAQNPLPPEEEVDRLRSETKMTRREIDSWFSERRKRKGAEEHKKAEDRAFRVEEEEEEEAGGEEEGAEGGGGGEESLDSGRESADHGLPESSGGSCPPGERKVSPIKINLKNLKVTEANGQTELTGQGIPDPEEDSSIRSSEPPRSKANCKKTAQQRHLLRQHFVQTQWPTNQEYDNLVTQSGLPRAEVVRWFGDSRYALKNGQLKWYEDYKQGDFPPGLSNTSPSHGQLLQDYYRAHKVPAEGDLQSLCDQTQMTARQIKLWFAEKTGEEARTTVSDAGSEDRGSSPGEPAGNPKGTFDDCSEVAESGEAWEPSGREVRSEPLGPFSPRSGIQLEAD